MKSRRMRWTGHVACTRKMRNAYKILVGKSEVRRPLKRPRCRWEGNIKMDLREIELEDVDWAHLTQDKDQWLALVSTIINH
jgi:hypothetical protein